MRRKLFTGVLFATMMFSMVACGSKEDNTENENKKTTVEATEDVTIDDVTDDVTEEITEETPAESEVPLAFQYQIRWMTQHNFSEGELIQPDGMVLFPEDEKYVLGNVAADAKNNEDMAKKLGEVISPGREILCSNVYVENISDTDKTVEECLDNGWYYISSIPRVMLGYTEERAGLGTNPDVTKHNLDTFYLDLLLEDFGTPSYISIFSFNDELIESVDQLAEDGSATFDSSVQGYLASAAVSGSLGENLFLGWEYEDYVIVVFFSDMMRSNVSSVPTCSIMSVSIYGKEVWESTISEDNTSYGPNVKDALYPEGFVLPEKVPYPTTE